MSTSTFGSLALTSIFCGFGPFIFGSFGVFTLISFFPSGDLTLPFRPHLKNPLIPLFTFNSSSDKSIDLLRISGFLLTFSFLVSRVGLIDSLRLSSRFSFLTRPPSEETRSLMLISFPFLFLSPSLSL